MLVLTTLLATSEVKLLILDLTGLWHTAGVAIAPEIQLTVQLMDIMAFMAVKHAGDAEAMRLHDL